ncbi:MAG: hypothetical protein PHF89_07620 [Eubacteriales bacterium]|nr:hypothetical protein [Eubacteriales bacterium]
MDDVPPEPQSGSTYFNNLLDSLLSIKRNHAFVPGYFKISNFAAACKNGVTQVKKTIGKRMKSRQCICSVEGFCVFFYV